MYTQVIWSDEYVPSVILIDFLKGADSIYSCFLESDFVT